MTDLQANQSIHSLAASLATASEALVVTDGLSRFYPSAGEQIRAVREVSLTLSPGTLVLIQGKSGSGKTTLLNLLGGLDTPTAGKVVIRGRDLTRLSRRELTELHRGEIGFVFQAFALMPGLTACENVDLPLRIAGCRAREAKARALLCLEQVGLAKRAHHRTEELSGGEQQRVAIARGLVSEPRLLLADEPTGELDHAMVAQIMCLFRQIVRVNGMTICLTSHDPAVEQYADRRYTMVDGELIEVTA
jgi:putative ABC transport system ATP-binding protein